MSLDDGYDRVPLLKQPRGFKESVNVSACRGYGVPVRTTHTLFADDGVAVRVPMLMVNGSISWHFATHKNQTAFNWTINPHEPMEASDEVKEWLHTWKCGGIGYTLRDGQRFYRTTEERFNRTLSKWEFRHILVQFVSSNREEQLVHLRRVTETEKGLVEREEETLPVKKFMDDYCPVEEATYQALRKYEIDAHERNQTSESPIDHAVSNVHAHLVPALSLYTLWKILRQWRKVHLRAEEKKYAPGGVGQKRAREEFERECGREKSEDELVGELLADRDAFFSGADWDWLDAQCARESVDTYEVALSSPYMRLVAVRLQYLRGRAADGLHDLGAGVSAPGAP